MKSNRGAERIAPSGSVFKTMTDYERLDRQRRGFKKKLEDMADHAFARIHGDAQKVELETLLKFTEKEMAKFLKVHEEMEALVEDEGVQETNQKLWLEVLHKMLKVTTELTNAIQKSQGLTGSSGVRVGTKVRAPEMKLPKFEGNPLEFTSFWDQFTANVDNSDLDPVQKLTILLSHLKGKAKSSVDGYSVSADNYSVVKDELKRRFGRTDLIVEARIRKISQLDKKEFRDPKGIQRLTEIMRTEVRSLQAMGKDPMKSELSAAEVLLALFKAKLPAKYKRKWEEHVARLDSSENSLEKFFQYFEAELVVDDALDCEEYTECSSASGSGDESKIPKTTCSFHVKAQRPHGCMYCHGRSHHDMKDCPNLHQMSVKERRNKVAELKGCFGCLRKGHQVSECETRCSVCGNAHNEILHEYRSDPRSRDDGQPSETRVKSHSGKVVDKNPGIGDEEAPVYLQTARATVESESGKRQEVRILLDNGSDRSLIRKDIAEKIGATGYTKWTKVGMLNDQFIQVQRSAKVKLKLYPIGKEGGEAIDMKALTLGGSLTEVAPPRRMNYGQYSHLNGLQVSDGDCRMDPKIDILIGADYYWNVVNRNTVEFGTADQPVAVDTKLGWVLSGPYVAG